MSHFEDLYESRHNFFDSEGSENIAACGKYSLKLCMCVMWFLRPLVKVENRPVLQQILVVLVIGYIYCIARMSCKLFVSILGT